MRLLCRASALFPHRPSLDSTAHKDQISPCDGKFACGNHSKFKIGFVGHRNSIAINVIITVLIFSSLLLLAACIRHRSSHSPGPRHRLARRVCLMATRFRLTLYSYSACAHIECDSLLTVSLNFGFGFASRSTRPALGVSRGAAQLQCRAVWPSRGFGGALAHFSWL